MIYEIVITGDTNDADYTTRTGDITQEQIDRFMPLIKAIKEKKGKWPISKYADGSPEELYPKFAGEPREDEDDEPTGLIGEFMWFVPWDIHSIESIVYYEKPVKTVLL